MPIIYDQEFNQNELFVFALLLIGILLVWKVPKRFPAQEGMIYFLYSVFFGIVFDHSISIEPFDYYDVNDSSYYQILDFMTYFMYGSFAYLYIYIFDYLKIRLKYVPVYILIWALISTAIELLAVHLGVFHYKNGYMIYYSFSIYLLIFVPNLCLYFYLNPKKQN